MTRESGFLSGPDEATLEAFSRHQAGDLAGAHSAYRALLAANPDNAFANLWMAALLHQAGRSRDAEAHAARATELAAQLPDAWVNLGIIRRALGEPEQARAALERAVELDATIEASWLGLGAVRQELGDLAGATTAYETAAKLAPGSPLPDFNLATLRLAQGRYEAAMEAVRRSLAIDPNSPAALGLLATCLVNLGDYTPALEALHKAEQLDPRNPDLPATRGTALVELGQLEDAVVAFDRALQLKPDHGPALASNLFTRRRLAAWDGIDRLKERFRQALAADVEGLAPFPWLAEDSTRQEQLRCARLWSDQWSNATRTMPIPALAAEGERLTIAYLSADYYRHPTAYLAAGLFEEHDRSRFRVLAYSNSRDENSAIRQRLEQAFDAFIDIRRMDVEAVTEHMRRERVDVLVDLKGHTLEASTAVVAQRAAPIQVQYLGFPGTLGLDTVDYLIGDAVVTPFAEAGDYDEHIVQLPGSYQVNDARRPLPPCPDGRSDHGLPEDQTVFCCFNNAWKFNESTFSTWMGVLAAVPGSVLWLLGREAASGVAARLRARAEALGIDRTRLVFSKSRPLANYLALYHHADLFLDSWPYNAHTTGSDALWMGCPMLTLEGDTFAGRVGASLLRASGLDELVTGSIGDYRERAIELGRDRDQLAALRHRLVAERADNPLFDTVATTRAIEAAYEEMARRHRSGAPGPFRVDG